MKHLFFLSLFIFSVSLSAQDGFVRTNCGNLKLLINSNVHKTVNFLSENNYKKIIKYYRFNRKNTEYFHFSIPPQYSFKDFKIIDDKKRKKIAVDLISYQLKKGKPGSKYDYEYDKDDYCRKFLLIE